MLQGRREFFIQELQTVAAPGSAYVTTRAYVITTHYNTLVPSRVVAHSSHVHAECCSQQSVTPEGTPSCPDTALNSCAMSYQRHHYFDKILEKGLRCAGNCDGSLLDQPRGGYDVALRHRSGVIISRTRLLGSTLNLSMRARLRLLRSEARTDCFQKRTSTRHLHPATS